MQNAIHDLSTLAHKPATAVYFYSCASRASALGEEIELEISPLQSKANTALIQL